VLFDFIKFSFKLYALVVSNLRLFFRAVPHKVARTFHKVSHTAATKSRAWVDESHNKKQDECADTSQI
jgi:hypothetical protein